MRLPEFILTTVPSQPNNPLVYCGHCDSIDNVRLDEMRDERNPEIRMFTASCARCGEIMDTDCDPKELAGRLRCGVSG